MQNQDKDKDMVTFRRQNIKVRYERREFPRIEYHSQAAIRGIAGMASIIDFSIGGVFLELNSKHNLKPDDIIHITIKLPTEPEAIHIRAKIMNIEHDGIGCMFVDVTSHLKEILENFFEFSRDMLQI